MVILDKRKKNAFIITTTEKTQILYLLAFKIYAFAMMAAICAKLFILNTYICDKRILSKYVGLL